MNLKNSYCTFRLDDITPAMDWQKFYRMKDIFDKYNVKPLIGVIPENRDEKLNVAGENPNFWKIIRQLVKEGWTVAQHGYQHLYVTQDSGILKINNYSEFAGLTYDEQAEKIKKGRGILEYNGISSNIFMAPAHSFDKNTLRALKDNGFRYVSDGYSRYPYEYLELKFIPCRHVLPAKASGVATGCIHANTVKEKVFLKIEDFLKDNRCNLIDFSQALEITSRNTARLGQGYYILLYHMKKFLYYYAREIRKG